MNAEISDRQLVTFSLEGPTLPKDGAAEARSVIDEMVGPAPFTVLVDARSLDVSDVRPSELHRSAMLIGDVALADNPYCAGAAFLVPETLRASLGSVLRMKSWDTPHAIFAEPERARDWLLSLQPREATRDRVSSAVEKWLG